MSDVEDVTRAILDDFPFEPGDHVYVRENDGDNPWNRAGYATVLRAEGLVVDVRFEGDREEWGVLRHRLELIHE